MNAQAWITLVIGLGGVVGVLATLWQRERSDRRAEWFRRFAWSAEHAFSDDPNRQAAGIAAVAYVLNSSLVGPDEAKLARSVIDEIWTEAYDEEEAHDLDEDEGNLDE